MDLNNQHFVYINKDYQGIREHEVGIVKECKGDSEIICFLSKEIEVPKNILVEFDINKTGDQFDYKICNRCGRYLPVTHFQKNQNGKNNRTVRRPSCKDCRDYIDGIDIPETVKKEWEKTKPEYEIWECPICKKRTIPGLTSKVVLDHDHETGKPRAWICDSCNTGLGRFQDNIDILENAIEYLKKYKSK